MSSHTKLKQFKNGLDYCLTLEDKGARILRKFGNLSHTTQRQILEDQIPLQYRCENLKSG